MHSESPDSFSGAFLPGWDLLAVKVCLRLLSPRSINTGCLHGLRRVDQYSVETSWCGGRKELGSGGSCSL